MKIYRQTADYLEIRGTDRQIVAIAMLFGLMLLSVGSLVIYQFRYEIDEIPYATTGGTWGVLLILAGAILLTMVSFLTTFYLSYSFDKELGIFCLTYRTIFRKTTIRRSIFDVWQLWVDGEPGLMGPSNYHITIVMNCGEQIKIPNLGSTPIEQEYHEYLAYEIGEFLGTLPDVAAAISTNRQL
jgi:hypothetical protein